MFNEYDDGKTAKDPDIWDQAKEQWNEARKKPDELKILGVSLNPSKEYLRDIFAAQYVATAVASGEYEDVDFSDIMKDGYLMAEKFINYKPSDD